MSLLAATTMNFGERAAYAGRMMLIGLCTVFAVLAILWGALALFRVCITRRKKPIPQTTPPASAAPVSEEGVLIAAITAAVAAALAAEHGGEAPAFRVVSFRKINTLQK